MVGKHLVTTLLVTTLTLTGMTWAAYLDILISSLCTDVGATVTVGADPLTTTVTKVETTTLAATTITKAYTETVAAAGAAAATSTASPAGCLTSGQAREIVGSFKTILSAADRGLALATAQSLIAEEFIETSDSLNSLAGLMLGNYTYPSKTAFLDTIVKAAAIPEVTTLDIVHDCGRIAWFWAGTGIGSGLQQVRGMYLLYLTPDRKQVSMALVELNSLAWAKDDGWRISRPDGKVY